MQGDNNKMQGKKDFDEIIKMACQKNIAEYDCDRAITDEERLAQGKKVPSDDLIEVILSRHKKIEPDGLTSEEPLVVEEQTDSGASNVIRFKKLKLISIVAILAAMMMSALVSTGVIRFTPDNDTIIIGDSIHVKIGQSQLSEEERSEIQSYSEAEAALGVTLLRPGYMPEGMVLDCIRTQSERARILYRNTEGKSVQFIQRVVHGNQSSESLVNATEAAADSRLIGGREVSVVYFEQNDVHDAWITATWFEEIKDSNNIISCEITTNLTEDELIKIIENLK